jgi:hypothetical protein
MFKVQIELVYKIRIYYIGQKKSFNKVSEPSNIKMINKFLIGFSISKKILNYPKKEFSKDFKA